jgi:hypothetical protein
MRRSLRALLVLALWGAACEKKTDSAPEIMPAPAPSAKVKTEASRPSVPADPSLSGTYTIKHDLGEGEGEAEDCLWLEADGNKYKVFFIQWFHGGDVCAADGEAVAGDEPGAWMLEQRGEETSCRVKLLVGDEELRLEDMDEACYPLVCAPRGNVRQRAFARASRVDGRRCAPPKR